MKSLHSLYSLAHQENIPVDYFRLQKREALSVQLPDGTCAIAIDPFRLQSEADERTKLSHELGHCLTGSFYNTYSPCDLRQKHENRADKWAITHLLPPEDLDTAIAEGCTELWQLADRFGITEDLAKKAVCYYVHGNLAAELYF